MIEQHGCEMVMDGFPVGAASIDGEDEWKPEDYRRMKKKLDALPEVRETYLKKGYSEYTDDDGNDKKELYYQLYVGAKETSDLNGCAKQIEKDTGYAVRVNSEIATHLGQGTEEDSMARSAGNAIVAMIGALFASFVMLVIRNTMMLPVLERMKEYGVLRCVGMSKRQLSFMLAVEGVLLTLLSTVLGTAIGFALLRSCQGWINDCLMLRVPVRFHFYPLAVLYSCLLCIGVTLLALMEPARQAGNRSVQETLRGGVYGIRTDSGKKKSGRHTISHLFGRIFGVEWEYAARGGTETPYFFTGNPKDFSDQGFWRKFFDAKTDSISSFVIYAKNSKNRTQEPGEVKANPFGLKNMLGNVMEYCADKYDPQAYSKGGESVTNPLITEGEEWVVRGGNYTSDAADVRSAARDYTKHDAWLKTDPQQPKSIWWYSDIRGIGFRVVCEPDPAIGAK